MGVWNIGMALFGTDLSSHEVAKISRVDIDVIDHLTYASSDHRFVPDHVKHRIVKASTGQGCLLRNYLGNNFTMDELEDRRDSMLKFEEKHRDVMELFGQWAEHTSGPLTVKQCRDAMSAIQEDMNI